MSVSQKFQFYFKKGSSKKFPMSVAPRVRRRKEPILGHVPKNNQKNNLVHKGLTIFYHDTVVSLALYRMIIEIDE